MFSFVDDWRCCSLVGNMFSVCHDRWCCSWVGNMAQQVKAPATKPKILSVITSIYMVEREGLLSSISMTATFVLRNICTHTTQTNWSKKSQGMVLSNQRTLEEQQEFLNPEPSLQNPTPPFSILCGECIDIHMPTCKHIHRCKWIAKYNLLKRGRKVTTKKE